MCRKHWLFFLFLSLLAFTHFDLACASDEEEFTNTTCGYLPHLPRSMFWVFLHQKNSPIDHQDSCSSWTQFQTYPYDRCIANLSLYNNVFYVEIVNQHRKAYIQRHFYKLSAATAFIRSKTFQAAYKCCMKELPPSLDIHYPNEQGQPTIYDIKILQGPLLD